MAKQTEAIANYQWFNQKNTVSNQHEIEELVISRNSQEINDFTMNCAELLSSSRKLGIYLSLENDQLKIQAPKGMLTKTLKEQFQSHKDIIANFLDNIDTSGALQLISDEVNRYEPFPLTDLQQAYWLGNQEVSDLGSSAFFYSELQIDLAWNSKRFKKALDALITRHEMLRAVILPDGKQKILQQCPTCQIDHQDFRHLSKQQINTRLKTLRTEMMQTLPSLYEWPLFDIRIIQLKEGFRLHYIFHLILCDAVSIKIFVDELLQLYQQPDQI